MNFTGSDWALIITAIAGLIGVLGTQIASLMVSLGNARHLREAKDVAERTNVKIDDAKVAAIEAKAAATETKSVVDATKDVVDGVKIQTDGLTSGAIASALAQGTAEGNLAGRKEQAAEIKEADETLDRIPNRPVR